MFNGGTESEKNKAFDYLNTETETQRNDSKVEIVTQSC